VNLRSREALDFNTHVQRQLANLHLGMVGVFVRYLGYWVNILNSQSTCMVVRSFFQEYKILERGAALDLKTLWGE